MAKRADTKSIIVAAMQDYDRVKAEFGEGSAEQFSMACAAASATWLTRTLGPRLTYDLLQNLADAVAEELIAGRKRSAIA